MADLTMGTTLCENCDKEINKASFLIHQVNCLRKIVKCEKCKMPIEKDSKEAHFKEFHSEVQCECGEKVERALLEAHKKETCKKRQAQCFYCDLSLDFNKLTEHMNFCGSRTEKCAKCHRFVQLKDKSRHEDTNCAYPEEKKPPPPPPPPKVVMSENRHHHHHHHHHHRHDIMARKMATSTMHDKPPSNNLLPCEFCESKFSPDELIQHQAYCDRDGAMSARHTTKPSRFDMNGINHVLNQYKSFHNAAAESDNDDDEDENDNANDYLNSRTKATVNTRPHKDDHEMIKETIPCELCNKQIDISAFERHQMMCIGNPISTLPPRTTTIYDTNERKGASSYFINNEPKPQRHQDRTSKTSGLNHFSYSPPKRTSTTTNTKTSPTKTLRDQNASGDQARQNPFLNENKPTTTTVTSKPKPSIPKPKFSSPKKE